MSFQEETKTDLCRLCARSTEITNENNLFLKNNRLILQQIKDLTGIRIKDIQRQKMPRAFCAKCKDNLCKASEFRLQIIETQKYFKSKDYNKQIENQNVTESPNQSKTFDMVFISSNTNEVNEEFDVKPFSNEFDDENITAADCIETLIEDINLDIKLESNDAMLKNENIDLLTTTEENIDKGKQVKGTKIKKKKLVNETSTEKKPRERKQKQPKAKKHKEKNPKEKIPKQRKPKTIDPEKKLHHFVCEKCGSSFQSRPGLDAHLLRHTEEKKFGCESCEAKFFSPYELQRHIRFHTGEAPYQCRHCDRRFRDYSHRQRHERSKHLNLRPFSCSLCDKTFTNNYIAKNHMLTHTKLRAFECKVCEKYFLRNTHLITHYRSFTHKNNLEKFGISNETTENKIEPNEWNPELNKS